MAIKRMSLDGGTEQNELLSEEPLTDEVEEFSDLQYDKAAKTILSEPRVLSQIVSDLIPEFRYYTIDEIMGCICNIKVSEIGVDRSDYRDVIHSGVEDTTTDEGYVTFDVLCDVVSDKPGVTKVIINLEMQNDWNPGYPVIKRALYYCSRLISRQKLHEFTGSNYQDIRKVYSIWFYPEMNDDSAAETSIVDYSVHPTALAGSESKIAPEIDYDVLTVLTVRLGSDTSNYVRAVKLLGALFNRSLSNRLKSKTQIDIIGENTEVERSIETMTYRERFRAVDKREGKFDAVICLMKETGIDVTKAMNMLHVKAEDRDYCERYVKTFYDEIE